MATRDFTWTHLSLHAEDGTLCPNGAPSRRRRRRSPPGTDGSASPWTVPEDVDIIGPMALRIFVTLNGGDDASLFAGVRKFRNGEEVTFEGSFGFAGDMVTKGWQRVAHRERDERLSTPEQPVHWDERAASCAGEIVPVDIALSAAGDPFPPRRCPRVDLRGSWHYPRDPVRGQFPTGAISAAPE